MRTVRSPRHLFIALLAVVSLASRATAGHLSEFDAAALAPSSAPAAQAAAARRIESSLGALARVQSRDDRYGVPAFVWGLRRPAAPATGALAAQAQPQRSADAAARSHLGSLAPLYRLQRADIGSARLARLQDTGSGPIIASYVQQSGGIDVFRDEFRVCLDRNLELVAVAGYLPAIGAAPDAAKAFELPSARAVALALRDFAQLPAEPAGVTSEGAAENGYEKFAPPASLRERTDGLAVAGGLRARKVWFHLGDALEPAWYVEVVGETSAYAYVLSATDGRLLFRHSTMQDATYSYRVWANTTAPFVPMDGPQGDGASPHPTGLLDLYNPPLIAPNLITLDHGPISSPDPWLPAGATETTGNNVDAYVDIASPDGFSAGDLRAGITAPSTFDRVYNVALAPGASSAQRMAAATTLFYINNYLHDMFYDSGLDEAAGNAQTSNFGRGGVGGDPILAEGQDYGGTNNANMNTPADGGSPRMQMYVFNPTAAANLVVGAPAGIAGTYAASVATAFGQQTFALSGQVVAGTDAAAPINDACSAITSAVAGKIALVDRGTCGFAVKAQNAQTAGAIGVIIVDNVASSTPPGLGGSATGITIPVLGVTQATGALIRAQLASGVTVTMNRPTQVQRDGTIDGHIVAHEWGHYVSNRLIGNAAGLDNQQGGGMGEGWSDFFALLMTVRPGENLAGCYNIGPYALSSSALASNVYYFGIRRYPYSTDMSKSPLTFKHIADGQALPAGPPLQGDPTGATNSEVHRTGEVWCTMLWECYAALLADSPRLTFTEAQRRMKLYLISGLKLTPNSPTFVDARDGILAAALANDPADFALLAQAFARRGLGTGAVAPPRSSADNAGVVESFAVGADLTVGSATLTDDQYSCDADSYLDNGERGLLTVSFTNTGITTLSGTTVSVSCSHPGVTFPGGNVFPAASTSPYTTTGLSLPVDLTGASPGDLVEFTFSIDDPSLLVPGPRQIALSDYVHVDEELSTSDLAETHHTTWTSAVASGSAGTPWARAEVATGAHAYHVADAGGIADLSLVSPPLPVSSSLPFSFTFQHRWSFEFDASANYDGGVIELSNNDGASWVDIGGLASTAYTGTLTNTSGNPIGGRAAWVQTSAGYPAMVSTTVNLANAYAGQTIRVRFRHTADAGVGGPGWWIDNLFFSGLTAPTFWTLAAEAGACSPLAVGDERPGAVALSLSSGNPSRGTARLRFALPSAARARLTVHDLAGRLVATLADGEFGAGWHDAAFTRADDGRLPGAGVYFARLTAGERQYTQRIVVLR